MGLNVPNWSRGSAPFIQPPNPDPYKFKIKAFHTPDHNSAIAVLIRYPGCTTYGGAKILVYEDRNAFRKLVKSGRIDPHFVEGETTPIARFPGDSRGWEMAMKFAETLK